MRTNFRIYMIAPVLLLAVACGKTDYTPREAPHASRSITNKDTQKKVIEMAGKLPDLAIYNSTMDKVIIIEMNQEKLVSGMYLLVFESNAFSLTQKLVVQK